MKIFVDDWFATFLNQQPCVFFYKNFDDIPNDCDIIGITFYNSNYKEYTETIQNLKKKCRYLIVVITEPTDTSSPLQSFLKQNNHPDIFFFGDAVLNYNAPNWNTAISWFIIPDNVYVTRPWAQKLLTQLLPWQQKNPKYMFDALLGTVKNHRDTIESFYNASPVKDKILYSYFKAYQNLDGMFLPSNIGNVDRFHNTTVEDQLVNIAWMIPVDVYNNSWYSVVAETTVHNANNQYTEKVAKPLVAGRPFVVFAGQNYLSNLRKLGFKTFDSVIDESYDTIADLNLRMQRAWQSVELLCQQDPVEVYSQLESVLEHNRQHFLNTDWHKPIKDMFNTLG